MIDDNPPYPDYAPATELDQALARIAQAVLEYRVDFLFGAGMSSGCGVLLGNALAKELIRHFFPSPDDQPTSASIDELASRFPLEVIAEAFQHKPGSRRADLTRTLAEILFDPSSAPGPQHDMFLSICFWDMPLRVRRVFTTNFDTLIERALDLKAVTIHRNNYSTIRDAERDGLIPVIHLHGVLESDYQITESDVFSSSYDPTHALFRSALAEADVVVLVGYSLNDPDFRELFLKYREEMKLRGAAGDDRTTFVVGPCPDRHSYALGSQVWRSRGALWIPLDALNFLTKLRVFLEARAGTAFMTDLRRKFSLADEDLVRHKVSSISTTLCVQEADALAFLRELRTATGSPR